MFTILRIAHIQTDSDMICGVNRIVVVVAATAEKIDVFGEHNEVYCEI